MSLSLKTMSAYEEAADIMCCASCGKAEVDDVNFLCTACKLVKYCVERHQENHRLKHKKAYKQRMAEIRENKLFTQPEISHYGECPICYLPLPLDETKFILTACCYKRICDGCDHANKERIDEEGLEHNCPFCREPLPETDEECDQKEMERVKVNDPDALCNMGKKHYDNKGDHKKAFEYWTRAAELGDAEAHFNLSILYQLGEGVEKDKKKEVYHLEEAAIGGHPDARFNLGCEEWSAERDDRATKHFIIAANLGHDRAMEEVKEHFLEGLVSEEELEAALREHKAAVDATKSKQREEAYAAHDVDYEA